MTDHRPDNPDRLLDLNALADYLGCSRSHAARLLADGVVPSFKLGGLRRVRQQDLAELVEAKIERGFKATR